jgi:hypothetical protein
VREVLVVYCRIKRVPDSRELIGLWATATRLWRGALRISWVRFRLTSDRSYRIAYLYHRHDFANVATLHLSSLVENGIAVTNAIADVMPNPEQSEAL